VAFKSLALRREDQCSQCGTDLAAGTVAWWDSVARTVTCAPCHHADKQMEEPPSDDSPPELDRGRPGASLEREHERRRTKREQSVRDAHPHIGGLLLTLSEPPQHETAFLRGYQGEQAVADSLKRRTEDGSVVILHNRRMPQGRGDIDHVAIAPNGVFVIDSKDIKGSIRVDRPWLGQPKLRVNGRDQTNLIDGLDRQVQAVRAVLDAAGHTEMALHGVLCFTRAELPMIGTLHMRGHQMLYRKALAKRLNSDGPTDPGTVMSIARTLAKALPSK
jgi:hypothetical protein